MVAAVGSADSFELDALAISDRFRLFNFTRRDDYLAYLWVLRAMDRLRGMHVAQSHTDDVAVVLSGLATAHHGVPPNLGNLRERLDNLSDDGCCTGSRTRHGRGAWRDTGIGSRSISSPNWAIARIRRSRACSPPGSRTPTCPGWSSPTSCATCADWRRRTATATATRSCAAWPALTGRSRTWRAGPPGFT